jgi:hypothetical protein
MRTQDHMGTTELFLLEDLRLTTHRNRQCPFCHGRVYREKAIRLSNTDHSFRVEALSLPGL